MLFFKIGFLGAFVFLINKNTLWGNSKYLTTDRERSDQPDL